MGSDKDDEKSEFKSVLRDYRQKQLEEAGYKFPQPFESEINSVAKKKKSATSTRRRRAHDSATSSRKVSRKWGDYRVAGATVFLQTPEGEVNFDLTRIGAYIFVVLHDRFRAYIDGLKLTQYMNQRAIFKEIVKLTGEEDVSQRISNHIKNQSVVDELFIRRGSDYGLNADDSKTVSLTSSVPDSSMKKAP